MKSYLSTLDNLELPLTMKEVFSIRAQVNKSRAEQGKAACKKWTEEMSQVASEIVRAKVRNLIAEKKWESARLMAYSAMMTTIRFSNVNQSQRLITIEQRNRFSKFIMDSLKHSNFSIRNSSRFGTWEYPTWPMMTRAYIGTKGKEMRAQGKCQFTGIGS